MSESFYSQVLSNCQEGVELLLGNIDLPVVHEVEHRLQVCVLHTLHVQQGMGVVVAAEDIPEKWTACTKYYFVRLNLLIVTGKRNIKEVFVIPKFFESITYITFKVIPAQAKLFTVHFGEKHSSCFLV